MANDPVTAGAGAVSPEVAGERRRVQLASELDRLTGYSRRGYRKLK
jgi:hypothetical protein